MTQKKKTCCLLLAGMLFGCDDTSRLQTSLPTQDTAVGHWIEIGPQDTFLKRRIVTEDGEEIQAGSLEPSRERCALYAGSRIPIQEPPQAAGSHILVNTSRIIPGCQFSKGYVYIPHLAGSSADRPGPGESFGNGEKAFLDMIAYAEGTLDAYNLIFGFQVFHSYADHPRKVHCAGRLCSSAAGRYQILAKTWDRVIQPALRLPDFSPPSQDRGALHLIRNRGVSKLRAPLAYPEFQRAVYKIAREWASLPGSPYGQPRKSMAQVWQHYRHALSR